MKLLLSPTKTMQKPTTLEKMTTPLFFNESEVVRKNLLSTLEKTTVKAFFKLSEKKEGEVKALLEGFESAPSCPALLSFNGLVFKYLNPEHLSQVARDYLKTHLYIFSGLYGLLRAYDGIKPYRLDYENPLKIDDTSLEAYWSEQIATYLNQAGEPIFNLASKEYYKPLLPKLNVPVYTFDFKVLEKGKLKTKATLAKMARGEMLRLLAEGEITNPAEAKKLKPQGFTYDEEKSTDDILVYLKTE